MRPARAGVSATASAMSPRCSALWKKSSSRACSGPSGIDTSARRMPLTPLAVSASARSATRSGDWMAAMASGTRPLELDDARVLGAGRPVLHDDLHQRGGIVERDLEQLDVQ